MSKARMEGATFRIVLPFLIATVAPSITRSASCLFTRSTSMGMQTGVAEGIAAKGLT